MNKIENYIFYYICEISIDIFNETNFSNYWNFCSALNSSLIINNMSNKELTHITKIIGYLKLLFGLTDVDSLEYIIRFFYEEKYKIFEEPIYQINACFKNALN